MSDESKPSNAVAALNPQVPTSVPTTVPLSPSTAMDLSWLPEEKREALLVEYTKGMLDLGVKAQELHIDVATLKNTLDQLASTTKEVSEGGDAITVTHTQTTSIGRTEVIMGNTPEAEKGKFTSSQTGRRDMTPIYVIGGLIAAVLIAAVAFG